MTQQVYFQKGKDVDKHQAFADSFGKAFEPSKDDFGGESVKYWDPLNRVDKRSDVIRSMQKASIDTQTGGAGTAGTALVPVWVDSSIVDRTVRETPLRNMFARRATKGLTYDYVPLTAKGGATFEFENANIADQVDVYDRVSVPIKFMYAKGRVSGPAIAGMRGFIDPQQLDLTTKATSLMELEEEAIINGDSSSDPSEFDGLIQTIATNTTDVSGLPSLADIRAEYASSYNNNGNVNVAVTDKSTHNYIKGLLIDLQRNVDNPSEQLMGFGIPEAFKFDQAMFITDKFMPTTGGNKRILFLDTRYIFMAVLQDLTYEEKYNEHDNYPYLMKIYETLVVTHEAASTQMFNIT